MTHWLDALPAAHRDQLDGRLLTLACRHAADYDDESLDLAAVDLADQYVEVGDHEGAAIAFTLAALIAHMRGDLTGVVAVGRRATSITVGDQPVVRFLDAMVTAMTASLAGDPGAAISAIDQLWGAGVPTVFTELVRRLHANMLCLCGRADEAVDVVRPLLESDDEYVRSVASTIRWQAGDPAAYPDGCLSPDLPAGTNDRYRLLRASSAMAVAASFGDASAVAAARRALTSISLLDGRDRVLDAVAISVGHVADHDEVGAEAVIRELSMPPPATR